MELAEVVCGNHSVAVTNDARELGPIGSEPRKDESCSVLKVLPESVFGRRTEPFVRAVQVSRGGVLVEMVRDGVRRCAHVFGRWRPVVVGLWRLELARLLRREDDESFVGLRRQLRRLRARQGTPRAPVRVRFSTREELPCESVEGARTDGGVEDDARQERLPRVRAPVREEDLPDPPRRQVTARVPQYADADDRDVDVVTIDLRDAPDGPLRDASFADDAIDARDDLRAVRDGDGLHVELLEVAEAEIHGVARSGTS